MFLFVTRNFPPDIGGIQSLMGGLSHSISDYGPVTVFADNHAESPNYDKNSQINIHRIGGIKLLRKYRKANLVNDFITKNRNIRAVFFDHWKSLDSINIKNLENLKVFCLIHSKEINHEINSSLNKRLIKNINYVDYIIANSHFTKKLAISVGIKENKIKIIFPGINKPKEISEKFMSEANSIFGDAFPKILTIARLDKRKGHDNILMSIRNLKIKFPKIKYVSVGSGNEEKNLIKLSNELSLTNEVIFLNKINENLKLSLIKKSNLFIMPSRIEGRSVEGFGISFIEAGSYGVGSIGGKDGGSSDAIMDNKSGILCDGNDLGSIYDSINQFFENDNYLKYGKAAKDFSEKFYWEKTIKKYLELLES